MIFKRNDRSQHFRAVTYILIFEYLLLNYTKIYTNIHINAELHQHPEQVDHNHPKYQMALIQISYILAARTTGETAMTTYFNLILIMYGTLYLGP